MKNRNTTLAGIAAIVAALSGASVKYFSGESIDFTSVMAAVAAGIGLIKAADSTPTQK